MTIVLLMAVVNYIAADNRVSITDFSISAGETKDVNVMLDNEMSYVAFQFDLYLPKDITLAGFEVNRDRVPESTDVSMAKQEDGSYRFLAAAMSMEKIVGSNGSIITLRLSAKNNITIGNKTGYLRDVKLSKADATGVTIAEFPFAVKVLAPITVTAKSYTREYGAQNPVFEYDVAGGDMEGVPTISCEATATSPVGAYPIVVAKGSVVNYNDSYVNGTLTITKAPLTVTAQSYVIKQGEALPTFEVAYEGFRNSETADVLAKRPIVTCAATSASAPNTYDIVVSGAESENYDISYVAGTLTIEAMELVPMEEDTEVSFEEIITEDTDLTNTVIDNVYVTLDIEGDDGYDTEEKCIVLASIVTEEQMETIADKDVKDETVKENYNGLIFAVPAGKGVISITVKTKGNRAMSVKVGDEETQTFVQPELGVVEIPYTSDKDTYVYIYGADISVSTKHRVSGANTDNGVLIYGIKWTAEESTNLDAIVSINKNAFQIFTSDGRQVENIQKGVNIIRFSDGTTKKMYVR